MWSSFTITSPDSPTVVRDRLASALTTAAPGWLSGLNMAAFCGLSGPTTFRGEVWDAGFKVTRNLARTERAMPIIATGRFVAAGDGTAVEVATRPQWWIVLVLCGWSAVWVQELWQRLVSDPAPGWIHRVEIWAPIGFVAFGWLLLFISCTVEERQYQQALARIVAADAEPGAAADDGRT